MTERFNDTSVDMQIIQTNFITFYTFLPSALPHHSDMYGRLFAKNLLHAIFLFFAHTKKRWWNPLDLTTIELYFWRSPHFWTLPILNVRFLSLISSWKNIVDENRSPFSWAHIASTRFSVPEGCNMVRGSWSQASPFTNFLSVFAYLFLTDSRSTKELVSRQNYSGIRQSKFVRHVERAQWKSSGMQRLNY